MQVMTGNGGRVVGLAPEGGRPVVEDGSAWLRERGVPVEALPEPVGVVQERDEAGRWV